MAKLPPPPAPPRWGSPSVYQNGKGTWEIEREYNELLSKSGIRAFLRRRWLSFTYGGIYIWTPDERRMIEEHFR